MSIRQHYTWANIYSLLSAGFGSCEVLLLAGDTAPDPDTDDKIEGPALVEYEEDFGEVYCHVYSRD